MNARAWFWMTRLAFAFIASAIIIAYVTNSAVAVQSSSLVADNSCFISNANNNTALAAHCMMNKDREVVISAAFDANTNVTNTHLVISAYSANLSLLWRDILRVCLTSGFEEHHHDLADAALSPCVSEQEKQLALSIYAPPEVQRLNVRYDPLFVFDADL